MFYNAKNLQLKLDDSTMDYVCFGSGKKNLIIIPGLGDGLKTVKGTALFMAMSFANFCKDYTCYVFSRKNDLAENYSIKMMANDYLKAMDLLKIEKADVMGVSQGGAIAQYMAVEDIHRINKLVLVVTLPKTNDETKVVLNKWIEYAYADDYKSLMIDTTEKSYSEKMLKSYRKFYWILTNVGKPKSFKRFIIQAKAILEFDCSSELSKITCPTLIIGGGKDQIVGCQAATELHSLIMNSELFVYPEYGHMAYEEGKDFNDKVLSFLNRN